ncbi:hypothetical protein AMTRI_Chr06g170070 [Amborella trichopoda]
MKRAEPFGQVETISSDDSSDSDPGDDKCQKTSGNGAIDKHAKLGTAEITKSIGGIDFEALKKHGYKGGPSVLKVPPPRVNETIEKNWSRSDGKKNKDEGETLWGKQERENRVA